MRELVDITITNYNNLDRDALYFDASVSSMEANWHHQLLGTTIVENYQEIVEHFDMVEGLPETLALISEALDDSPASLMSGERDVVKMLDELDIKIIYLSSGIMFIKTTTDYGQDVYKQLLSGQTPHTFTVYDYETLLHKRTHIVWTTKEELAKDIASLVVEPILVNRPTVAHIKDYLKVDEVYPGIYSMPTLRMRFDTFLRIVPEKCSEVAVSLKELEHFKSDEGDWAFADIEDPYEVSELFRYHTGRESWELMLKNVKDINIEDAVVIGIDDHMQIVTLNQEEYVEEVTSNINELELLRWVYRRSDTVAKSYIKRQKELAEKTLAKEMGHSQISILLTTNLWD